MFQHRDDARPRSYPRTQSRSRSRSPGAPGRQRDGKVRRRSPVEDEQRRERRRNGSEERGRRRRHHHHNHHHHRHRDSPRESSGRSGSKDVATPASLPYDARALSKNDLGVFRPLLAYYLDLQKQKDIRDMDEREVRGRWKSFVAKWNRGALSSGWYDPEMFLAAKERVFELAPRSVDDDDVDDVTRDVDGKEDGGSEEEDEDDDDDLGPMLPPVAREGGQRSGPGIPTLADLSLKRENLVEDAQREREARIEDIRARRKDDRKTQKERLDELVPRAEAGTRERMLEKKALVNEKMKDFKDKGDGQAEVGEQELMGGGDSLAEYRAMKAREERKKTEREIRREEVARARAAEREERIREYREREEGVMKGLKELAKQRFG